MYMDVRIRSFVICYIEKIIFRQSKKVQKLLSIYSYLSFHEEFKKILKLKIKIKRQAG